MSPPDPSDPRGSRGQRAGHEVAVGQMVPTARRDRDSAHARGVSIRVFATTPPSKGAEPDTYLQHVTDVARWSEAAGCEGTLVYTDNGLVDPWLLAQAIIESTERLCPLIAIQPVYMHPYTAAKMVASLGFMHNRRVWLNIVAGGFKNDLAALGDETPHDDRYERAKEYAQVMLGLLAGETTSLAGRYYGVKNLRMTPQLPETLRPGVLISGSSPAGFATARAIGAVPVKYPKSPDEEEASEDTAEFGVRIGIIARETEEEAWRIAHERFPEDRQGRIAHGLAMNVSDSRWHRQLSGVDGAGGQNGHEPKPNPYWLVPFQNYKTFCPYLVGAHDHIAEVVAGYMRLGATTFILDIPPSEDELHHTGAVLRAAAGAVR
ncbi:MAG: alkanesulfonate monooxygenase [Actinomycetota bacterium]|nr:alkanesulfonate monooxygenase [Actinomycetota bacterium]